MALCACGLALLVKAGHAAPGPVLALTLCIGAGSAFMWPAWQASMSGLVEPDEVKAAAMLNNLSYNFAAIVGPALGGVLFAWIGPGALFLINAVSFVGLLGVYALWWRESKPAPVVQTSVASSVKLGISTALACHRYRRVLMNVSTAFFATIALPACCPCSSKTCCS